MNSEPFWKLIANPGCELWVKSKSSMKSFSNLKTAIRYAKIDEELCELLREKPNRDYLSMFLLETYFPASSGTLNIPEGSRYESQLSKQIAEEEGIEYQRKILLLRDNLDQVSYEEEVFVRSAVFKREVARVYDNSCAVSGLRVDAVTSMSMIDACHIIPFSETHDDTLRNGIALCPNIHRAFDRGLISIDDDYRVIILSPFIETNSSYSIKQFDGIRINLPASQDYYPSIASLRWHRNFHSNNSNHNSTHLEN